MKAPQTITCIDCGGLCHMLPHPDSDFEPGDSVAYRCRDCLDRWDMVLPESDNEEEYDCE